MIAMFKRREQDGPDKPQMRPRSADTDANATEQPSSLKRLGVLLKPHSRRIAGVLLILFGLTVVNMTPPLLLKLLVDEVLSGRAFGWIAAVIIGYLLFYGTRNALFFQSKFKSAAIGEDTSFALRNRLFEKLQQMNLQFYRQNNPGKVSSRVMNDSFIIQEFIQGTLPTLLQSLFMFLGLVAVTYSVNWQLALAVTVVLPLHLMAYRHFRRPIKEASRTAQQQLAVVHGNLLEQFLGAEVVKGFVAEERENQQFQAAMSFSRDSQLRSHKYLVAQKVVADLLVGLGTIALIGFGVFQVRARGMEPGTFLAFWAYVMLLYPTVLELMSSFAKLTKATACIDRVFELLESDQHEAGQQEMRTSPIRGDIELRNVSFRYGDGPPVLRNISMKVPAGKVCAIIGPSGAGKSTLINLVPRFVEADLGQVLVDGTDVRRFDLPHLRSSIGIAYQDCFLFNTSILENLRYAQPDASMSQIIETAQRTGAHDFIDKLPNRYRTVVGEGGISLSRGEMQRITLTRAMLKQPRILVLDEATASIDSASQEKILPAILDFMHGKTTLMITHNPDLLRHADIVVQIVDGRVEFVGAADAVPADLMRTAIDTPLGTHRRDPDASGGWGASAKALIGAALITMACAAGAVQAQSSPPPPPKAEPDRGPYPEAATTLANEAGGADANAPGRFIPLAGLNEIEIKELIEVVIMRGTAQMKYAVAGESLAGTLPPPPPGVKGIHTIVKRTEQGLRLAQFGYKMYLSQPPHIYVYGQTQGETGVGPNPDVAALVKQLADGRKALAVQYQTLEARDLASANITLSYVEADRCLGMLKTLGYQCVEHLGKQGLGKEQVISPLGRVDVNNLPCIVSMPAPSGMDLVGGTGARGGSFGLTMTPSVPTSLPERTSAAPAMNLMVLYHPAHPEQFSQVLDRINTTIDTPARQILIEAMVLEISETGLDELGVRWELEARIPDDPLSNLETLRVGALPDLGGIAPTVDLSATNIFGHFKLQLQALVREGQAEILSRPSVLTLDNRQASLRVGEELPVATSASGLRGGDRISFDFKYIPVGILLNVRPRIAADGEEISMQIDGIVSAEVPGEELVIRDTGGEIVAEAPKIATRRVQTYGRIANNTPFIIGGLVAKDETSQRDKVPLLGDLPWVGGLFRSDETRRLKREVIIVITPYVLPDNRTVGRTMPKDEDAFDSFGNALFRDAYRIRAEDVFDLAFITENPQLKEMKRLANVAVRHDFQLADRYPFNRFTGRRIPGERILVYRQMYEVIDRLDLDARVNPRRLIFFKPDPDAPSGFDVTFLWRYLEEMAQATPPTKKLFEDQVPVNWLFEDLQRRGKALRLTYTVQFHEDLRHVLAQPVPEIELIDCPDRNMWDDLLWRLNQPDEAGRPRHTILLQTYKDLARLERAILLKRVVQLNANRQALTLTNFSIGRQLLMPSVKENKVYLVDDQVAKFFFYTDLYYPALQKELNRDLEALRNALQMPEVFKYIADAPIPQPEPFTPQIHLRPLGE